MANSSDYVPFSQRNGHAELPTQLKLGEVPTDLRRLIDYAVHKEIERHTRVRGYSAYFDDPWVHVAKDFHVRFCGKRARTFENDPYKLREKLEAHVAQLEFFRLFDLVEFFVRHSHTSDALKGELANSFVETRAAYRLFDGRLIAIGSEDEGQAVVSALADTEEIGAEGARGHLIRAGLSLRQGDWAGSVRESIHAVEAAARRFAPEAKTLGEALKKLPGDQGHHPALLDAFKKLYGYTNDAEGIRHATVFEEEASVDEVDALFMLGACASFVSYLIARSSITKPSQT